MRNWRSAAAGKIPPGLLRRAAPLLVKTRGPKRTPPGSGPVPAAEELRRANVVALRRMLEESSIAHRAAVHEGVPVQVLDSQAITADDIHRAVESSPLQVIQSGPLADGGQAFSLSMRTTGHDFIDRSLSARLALPAPESTSAFEDALEACFDVDLVYTWVDGTDPHWQGQRQAAESRMGGSLIRTSNDDGRFATHDELRYSLRSVEYFAPWIRRIFIVTAGQRPSWLEAADDRIHVVDHSEIFEDPANLPTFNSHAIEAQLHRVPGLAEHFIYMNDDVFLGQPVSPTDFFTPAGQPRFFLSNQGIRREGEEELPVDIAAKNNREIIEARFGRTVSRKFKHAPHAQRRSTLELIAAEHREATARTTAARFRSPTDLSIPSSLAHYYGLCLGSAVPSQIGYAYTDISHDDAQLRLLRMLRRGLPQTFCLNEVQAGNSRGRSGETARMLEHFLPRAFPLRSVHELAPAGPPAARQSTGIEGQR